jgi:hypothetical protein
MDPPRYTGPVAPPERADERHEDLGESASAYPGRSPLRRAGEDAPFTDEPTATGFALIDRMRQDRRITTVESCARAAGLSAPTVRRLFRDHIGVSAQRGPVPTAAARCG